MRPPRPRSVSLRPRFLLIAVLLGAVGLLAPAAASAGSREEDALRLADEAMNHEFLNEKYRQAQKTLKKALRRCGRRGCSDEVMGRLNRDMAMVQVALRKPKEARRRFKRALRYDPDITLDASLVTPEVEEAFRDAGGDPSASAPPPSPPPSPEPEPEPEIEEEEPEPEFEREPEVSRDAEDEEEVEEYEEQEPNPNELPDFDDDSTWDKVGDERKKRGGESPPGFYLSLSAQQDALYYPAELAVCNRRQANQYNCFDHNGEEYAGPVWDRYGNQVPTGIGIATTRVMLGLDGRLGKNVLLGIRLGYAFRGAPTPANGDGFIPWHAELRTAYHFGSDPFAKGKGRPFLSLGAGLAQIDSHVAVEYFPSEAAYRAGSEPGTLDVWRRTGRFFVAPGFGLMIPTSKSSGFAFELRGLYLFNRAAYGGALNLGYVVGL